MFPRNESSLDRGARAVAGGALALAAVATLGVGASKPLGVLAGLLGAVLLVTAATGSCPLYRLVGIDTAAGH